MTKPILYSFYRSACASRVRIALHLKGIEYEYKKIDLPKGEAKTKEFREINQRGLIPTLIMNGKVFTESLAIIEYLDELYPNINPLLPKNPEDRAKVRALAFEVSSNIQPLQNGKAIAAFGGGLEGIAKAKKFIEEGFEALEYELSKTSGKYSFGDQLTLADLVLPGQVYNAVTRFKIDMNKYPTIKRINETLSEIPEFIKADAYHQPDTPIEELRD